MWYHEINQLSDVQRRLVQALTGYRDYLGTGVDCEPTDYKPFEDPQFGRGYSPFGRVKCLRFDGADSVGHLRRLRKRARDAVQTGYAQTALRHAIDALLGTTALLSVQPDETVNRVNMMYTRKRAGTKLRQCCEYVRAEFVGVLGRMLARLPSMEPDVPQRGGNKKAPPLPMRHTAKELPDLNRGGRFDRPASRGRNPPNVESGRRAGR